MTKKSQVKYKKAPQAPRRFKSSYMFFSTDKHRQIRKELAEKGENEKVSAHWFQFTGFISPSPMDFVVQLSTTEVAKMVSQAWKSMSKDDREEWEEKARKDKARYEMEKSMYTGPWKIPAKKRSQKDPNAPKRPMSAFLSFSNSKRSEVKKKNPDIGNAEVSRILAQMWKDAAQEERKDHIDKEFKLRQEYKVAIAEWRKTSETEMQAARKEREDEAMRAVLAGKRPAENQDRSAEHAHMPYGASLSGSQGPSSGQYPPTMYGDAGGASMPPYYPPPTQYLSTNGYHESISGTSMDPAHYSYYNRGSGYDGYRQSQSFGYPYSSGKFESEFVIFSFTLVIS